MKRTRIDRMTCMACQEPIDDFHQLWFYVDEIQGLRVHAGCSRRYDDLKAERVALRRAEAAFKAPRSQVLAVLPRV